MASVIILLRIIHIFCGVFWVGFAMFNIGFLQPSVRALGPDAQPFMRHLIMKTRILNTNYIAATLTVLAGLALYWTQIGFSGPAMLQGKGLVFLMGGTTGIISWLLAMIFIRDLFNKMKANISAIQAQGTPPTPEQGAAMQGIIARLGKVSMITFVFLMITLLAMAGARYMV